jgi:hypothetical protein
MTWGGETVDIGKIRQADRHVEEGCGWGLVWYVFSFVEDKGTARDAYSHKGLKTNSRSSMSL